MQATASSLELIARPAAATPPPVSPGVDAAVIAAAQAGSHEAFEALYAHYQPPIQGFIYRYLNAKGGVELAEELTQDTFLKAFLSLRYTSDDLKFSAWLYQIAANVCRDRLRHEKLVKWQRMDDLFGPIVSYGRGNPFTRGAPAETGNTTKDGGHALRQHGHKLVSTEREQPLGRLLLREEGDQVQHVLALLPQRYRHVLWLREFNDLTYPEIAAVLNTTATAVKSLLFRARRAFAERWKKLSTRDERA